jgi:hypothetical protein
MDRGQDRWYEERRVGRSGQERRGRAEVRSRTEGKLGMEEVDK